MEMFIISNLDSTLSKLEIKIRKPDGNVYNF